MNSRRIAYVVNHAAFFVSHRLPLAIGARRSGFEVALFTGQAGSPSMERLAEVELVNADIPHQRVAFRSAGINPLVELWGLMHLITLLRRYQPDLVHCASPKGVIYGGLAARICGTKGLVLAISGMGYAFTEAGNRSLLRTFVKTVYLTLSRFVFRHPNLHVIVQNEDDYSAQISSGLVHANKLTLLPGSGVQLSDFCNCSTQDKEPIVLLPARMVRDKGIEEFVDAARQLKALVPEWRFVLAGAADYQNPSAISADQLEDWEREGIIEWLGHVGDMVPLFAKAAIVCLPSYYREGMPKVLLEAAAAACAVVTTDVAGCRDAVVPGVTGDLVPVRDSSSLAKAIHRLINDEQNRKDYGYAGQQLAMRKFSLDYVVEQTLNIYHSLI
jgi:glycosyltransferase involved in cell wall biosynthesis